jgi:predicted TIM-barrel fold metal-dependent hydrolase
MKIIDCHANIGWDTNNIRKNYFPSQQGYKRLLNKMNQHDVLKSIILPFPSPAGQFKENLYWYEMENHYLVQAHKFSNRFIPFPAVNPNDVKSVKNIKTLTTTFEIKGIKISHHIPMGFSVEKLIGHKLMKIVQDNNLLVMIHTGTGKEAGSKNYHETLDYGIQVAKKYPDVTFIFCHLGRLHKTIIEALKLENVYMDTSALSMYEGAKEFIAFDPYKKFVNLSPKEIIEDLVEMGFEDKIIFGSDEPYTFYEKEIGMIKNANISEDSKNKIFYRNIAKLLGIDK